MPVGNFGPREDHQAVEIRIFAAGAGENDFPVELRVLGGGPDFGGTLHLDMTRLLELAASPQDYGLALGKALFADEALGDGYRETAAAAQAHDAGLQVRLRIDPPELRALRWERIYHPWAGEWVPLGCTAATPFSRYVPAQQWGRAAPATQRPLRMLAIVASPADLRKYGWDPILKEERDALRSTLDGLPEVAVTYLETGIATAPTLKQIRQALAEGYQLVHFMCHGAYTEGQTVLYLEKDDGTVDPVVTGRLVGEFAGLATKPGLCFLAACETAERGRHDGFAPLGPALVKVGGVPAVVAMSDRVGVRTAQLFAGQFYARLLAHGMVDLAVNQARTLVRDEWDWGVPVLFSRLRDNKLLAVETREFKPFKLETVYVPAGPFVMGSPPGEDPVEGPWIQHEVVLPAYWIGKYPVTNAQYAEFVAEHPKRRPDAVAGWSYIKPPQDKLDHPVVGVSWHNAQAYCTWLGEETGHTCRLPTEAEWEKAARGDQDSRIYPWGDELTADHCNYNSSQTTPVDRYDKGKSPYACYDMVGNVREWTSTLWGTNWRRAQFTYPYDRDEREPREPDERQNRPELLGASLAAFRIWRGGAYDDRTDYLGCSARGYCPGDRSLGNLGFRVVREV
jgi:formylglycine-generating enzyme required for sulfatase activity